MVKIRMLQDQVIALDPLLVHQNEVVSLPTHIAASLVGRGLAVLVAEEPKPGPSKAKAKP